MQNEDNKASPCQWQPMLSPPASLKEQSSEPASWCLDLRTTSTAYKININTFLSKTRTQLPNGKKKKEQNYYAPFSTKRLKGNLKHGWFIFFNCLSEPCLSTSQN